MYYKQKQKFTFSVIDDCPKHPTFVMSEKNCLSAAPLVITESANTVRCLHWMRPLAFGLKYSISFYTIPSMTRNQFQRHLKKKQKALLLLAPTGALYDMMRNYRSTGSQAICFLPRSICYSAQLCTLLYFDPNSEVPFMLYEQPFFYKIPPFRRHVFNDDQANQHCKPHNCLHPLRGFN